MTDNQDDEHEEYTNWNRPQTDDGANTTSDEEGWGPPPVMREPLFRDRIRDRFGVGPQQWFILETFLLVAPYPVFILLYMSFDIKQSIFLGVTLIYSLIAIYIGLLS